MDAAGRRSDAELARLELENELDLWRRAVALSPRGASDRDASVAWFASGLPFPYFNQVLTVGSPVEPADLARAIAILRGRGDPFMVRIRDGDDDPLVPQLLSLGLREDPDERLPGMAVHPIDGPTFDAVRWTPAGLEIRFVEDARGLADHVAVVAAGFGMPLDLVRELFPPEELDVPGIAAFVGYAAGRPVASAFGYTAEGTVGVYNVATVAEVRRLGYGGAMTRRVVADGRERGAAVAILQSSPMGRRLYESLGFREVVSYRAFMDGPAAATDPR